VVPFLSLVSVAELSRNPTVKDEMAAAGSRTGADRRITYDSSGWCTPVSTPEL
jgi:hypothetical protein